MPKEFFNFFKSRKTPEDHGDFYPKFKAIAVQKVLVKMACILPYYLLKY